MKVTAFVGSARKKHTYQAVEKLLQKVQTLGNIEYEIVMLSEYNLATCKGCITCLDKGEELCPFKDDRDILIEKMAKADGVVFASPNYSFHVSGYMKVFLDRLGFIFHRPQFFGKSFTSIVKQGVYGGNKIIKYFNFIGKGMGFNVVKGSCITTREPVTDKAKKKAEKKLDKQSKKFYVELMKKVLRTPSLIELMMFRMSRSAIKEELDDHYRDYTYFKEKGWFESDFFYPVKLNPFKKLAGRLFDRMRF